MKLKIDQEFTVNVENKIRKLFIQKGFALFKEFGLYGLSDEPDNYECPSFKTFLTEPKTFLEIESTSTWKHHFEYNDYQGKTVIHFVNSFLPNRPTIIFAHGLLETNHLIQLGVVTDKELYKNNNIVSLSLNAHSSIKDVFKNCVNKFENAALMVASAVHAIEEVTKYHKKINDVSNDGEDQESKSNSTDSNSPTNSSINLYPKVLVTGISMGGIISSMHYFYFDSADIYIPIISYPNIGNIIFNKHNKDGIKNFETLSSNKSYFDCFKIGSTLKSQRNKNKAYPILAKKDSLIPYKEAIKFWDGYEVKTVETSHYSIVTERQTIINHIKSKLKNTV